MANGRYSDYLEISSQYESVVDIGADQRNSNLWREYVVGQDMCVAMDLVCRSFRKEEKDSERSFWIHGSYGTGKSYAGIFLKHLFEEPYDVVDKYLQSNQMLRDYRNRFMPIRDHGNHLVIWKSGCTGISNGQQLLMAIEVAITKRLKEVYGDQAYYGSSSLVDVVKEKLYDPSINWNTIINDPAYNLYVKFSDVDELRKAVEDGKIDVIGKLAEIMRNKGWAMVDSMEQFKAWMLDIVEGNHLQKTGIVFFWDEFTEYLRHGTMPDLDVVQKISELNKDCPLYMFFIVHLDAGFMAQVGEATYNKYVNDRFHQIEFRVSENSAHDLIANSIVIRPGIDVAWQEKKSKVLSHLKPYYGDFSSLDDESTKMQKLMDRLCPMHPMSIRLLSRVAENFAAASRTMFRFMKDVKNPDIGFVSYINNYGPEDTNCWLTPDLLWDYFFMTDADFHDSNTKAAQYIQHYNKKYMMLSSDPAALRVFKCAMLLMSVMSTAKTLHFVGKAFKGDGIAATKRCLELCFAGVYSSETVDAYLDTFSAEGVEILKLQYTPSGSDAQLELPYEGGSDLFKFRRDQNAVTYTRHKLFSKDGVFSKSVESKLWDTNDALIHRVKVISCCAEKTSINARVVDAENELRKYSYKFAVIAVAVKDAAEYQIAQAELHKRANDYNNTEFAGRIVFLLLKFPMDDSIRDKWLDEITYAELANEANNSVSGNEHNSKAALEVENWKSKALGSTCIVYCGDKVISGLPNVAAASGCIKKDIIFTKFQYIPETFFLTETGYKSCQEGATLAGIQLKGKNSQINGVIDAIKRAGVLECDSIETLKVADGSVGARTIAKLASFISNTLLSGNRIQLSALWSNLQTELGYFDCIATGVLLGFVFKYYINGEYNWTDEQQVPHPLTETTMQSMLNTMIKGKALGGYLSTGSEAWAHFRSYAQKLFALTSDMAANEQFARINAREKVTAVGTPYWALKYLSEESYGGIEQKKGAELIIDSLQQFVGTIADVDDAMSDAYNLFNQYPKVRGVLEKSFASKSIMATAFRSFVFNSEPELEQVTEKLNLQPIELNDHIRQSMQDAIYTWTEEAVKEKLAGIVTNLKLLCVLNDIVGVNRKEITEVQKDICNSMNHLCVPVPALKELGAEWFDAAQVLFEFAYTGIRERDDEGLEAWRNILEQQGNKAWQCITNSKLLIKDILEHRGVQFEEDDLNTIYSVISSSDIDAKTAVSVFEHALSDQLKKLTYSRNRAKLCSKWTMVTGTDSVKAWGNKYNTPVQWLVGDKYQNAVRTIITIQQGGTVMDSNVVEAINALDQFGDLLTDTKKIEDCFYANVGEEYRGLREMVLGAIKLKCGQDASQWAMKAPEIIAIMKQYRQQEAKKQKLQQTKEYVTTLEKADLCKLIQNFLDSNPEYCDLFVK